MDRDIKIEDPDILDSAPITDVFTDFSQVKIEVHGGDVAERIIEDLEDNTEDYDEAVTELPGDPEADAESYIQEISDDYSEQTPDDFEYIEEDHRDIADPQDCLEYAEVPIKEEIELFEGTDYTDSNEVPLEVDDVLLEDVYHFNNKIILGSKPCLSSAEVSLQEDFHDQDSFQNHNAYLNDVKKENQMAIVLLEDWGVHLQQSLSFCKKCDVLFPTPNALDAHNMIKHSFLVAVSKNVAVKSTAKPAFARKSTGTVTVKRTNNIARKSTGSKNTLDSKFCNHCNMVFSDHTALITHLYELLPLKQFNCKKCDTKFKTQKELVDHNLIHVKNETPVAKKVKNVKEKTVLKNKLLYEEDLKKKRPVAPIKDVTVIPKSVLFQCTKCNTHFLTALAGFQHTVNCFPSIRPKKLVACKICKRKLRDTDSVMHKKQHELCTKFKVYKTTKNLIERTLCKCPKCGLHFNDYTMKSHLKNCGKIPTAHCQKCNILLPKSNLDCHMKKHINQNLKPKDFIIIQYFIQNKQQKRKLEPIVTPAKKIKLEYTSNKIKRESGNKNVRKLPEIKIKKEPTDEAAKVENKKECNRIKLVNRLKFERGNKVRIYFCKNCNGCCIRDSRRTLHLSKKCKLLRLSDRVICQECGLQFNKKTIMSHEKLHTKRNLTIHNMVFYNIGTLKRVLPSLPTYPQCSSCKINFYSREVQLEHTCGENYTTCNKCGDKFDNSAYGVHMEFHRFVKSEQPKPSIEAKIMPELIKKYESMNMMWNVLYSCNRCDVATDLYDKAVEHSQFHLNQATTFKNIKCYICNMKFDETCWAKHSDLHSRMVIDRKDFKILTYDPHKLLTEDWFRLFETLPEDQIRQITDKSLYGYERSVKMKLLKDGRSEFTIYSCSNCEVSYQNNEIAKHVNSVCKDPANVCKICNIPFHDLDSLKYHKLLHWNGIKKEEFRLVSFLNETYARVEQKKSTAKFVFLQCSNCKACLRRPENIRRHNCLLETRRAECSQCNLIFHNSFLLKHVAEHRRNPDFNVDNITVKAFDPVETVNKSDDDDDQERDYIPFKRKYKRRKPLNPTKVVTNKVKRANLTKTKVSKVETSQSKAETTAKVFQCDCGLHFTSLKIIEKHQQTCSPNLNISKENCSKCGLLFPTDVLVSHLCKHHSKNTKIVIEHYRKSSFDSVESTSETAIGELRRKPGNTKLETAKLSPSQGCEVKLYKCSECNIYFLSQNTCYKHVYKSHRPIDPRRFIECKLCGLQFTINSLSLHITRHHQNEFSLDNVLVEEYRPPVGKGPPQIEIYIAAEKLQSLQVTSSIEG